jgi:hypothetical protein
VKGQRGRLSGHAHDGKQMPELIGAEESFERENGTEELYAIRMPNGIRTDFLLYALILQCF